MIQIAAALLLSRAVALPAFAQSTTTTGIGPAAGQTHQARISDTPFMSALGRGTSGALDTFATGTDAAIFNPAAIGGVHQGMQKNAPTLKHFHFPYVGAEFNEHSSPLIRDATLKAGASDLELSTAVTDAAAGMPQNARTSILPDLALGRMLLTPIIDNQISAIKLSDDSDAVEVLSQFRQGFGGGISFSDAEGTLYLGVFSSYSTVVRTSGIFTAEEVADPETRKDLFAAHKATFSGIDHNVGLLWRIPKKASPTLGLTAQHVGDAKYSSSKDGQSDLIDKQKINLSFGASPTLGKYCIFNVSAGGTDLTNQDLALHEKWRTSAEVNVGNNFDKPWFGVRAGANHTGISYGAHINVGLIGAQYANFPEDIGTDKHRSTERRQAAMVFVDLAD